MGRLYLIKHAPPLVEPARPARDWRLTDEGRRRAADLGERLSGRGIARCATSDEPKAHETGAIIASVLGVPLAVVPGLHEHDRSTTTDPVDTPRAARQRGARDTGRNMAIEEPTGAGFGRATTENPTRFGRATTENPMPFFADVAAFEDAIAEVFNKPSERVFGRESAHEAHDRFTAALESLIAEAGGPLAVISHGTVISLFVARRTGLEIFPLWKSLGLPSCAVLSLPDFQLIELLQPHAS